MVLAMLRCGMVGKWTGGAVGAETGKLIGDYKVFRVFVWPSRLAPASPRQIGRSRAVGAGPEPKPVTPLLLEIFNVFVGPWITQCLKAWSAG